MTEPSPTFTALYDRADDEPAPASRRSVVMAASGLVAALLLAVLTVLPSPYAIGQPGPTFDTLGEVQGVSLVQIDGAPTYDASGELRLTTVSVSRAGSRLFTLGQVMRGWAADDRYVLPEEAVFGTPDQEEDFQEQAEQDWITSQESATVSALEALGVTVPAELDVAYVDETSNALGLLAEDDVIVSVDGVGVDSFADLSDGLEAKSPGDDVTIGYLRDNDYEETTFATLDDGFGGAIMGIWIDPQFDVPIDVTVQIDSVGGPSAGLMFSLGIMDMLTEEDELDGARVAGTGAITAAGDVLPIGGIRMKMHGAADAGATAFLAPVENCGEVVGHIPAGLDVYAVDTLDDAYAAILGIGGGDTGSLPTCATV